MYVGRRTAQVILRSYLILRTWRTAPGGWCDDEAAMSAPCPRTTRAGGGLRILRAAVFAAVCVVLAGAGHSLASCEAVPLWTLGAGFLAAVAVAVPSPGAPARCR